MFLHKNLIFNLDYKLLPGLSTKIFNLRISQRHLLPIYTPLTPHLHHIYTPFTPHLHPIAPHLHPIYIPFAPHLHPICTLFTSHLHPIAPHCTPFTSHLHPICTAIASHCGPFAPHLHHTLFNMHIQSIPYGIISPSFNAKMFHSLKFSN